MEPNQQPSRRAVIGAGGVAILGLSAATLAACAPTPPRSTPATPSREPQQVPPREIPTPPPLASGTDLAGLADIPVGGTAQRTVAGQPILLAQPTAGTAMAFSAICTHQGCVVAAAATEFDCSCHGSRFEAATGAVINGPAVRPLAPIPVAITGDRVVVA